MGRHRPSLHRLPLILTTTTMQLTTDELFLTTEAMRTMLRQQLSLRHVFRPDRPDYVARQYAGIRASISTLRKLRKMERAAWVCEALAA